MADKQLSSRVEGHPVTFDSMRHTPLLSFSSIISSCPPLLLYHFAVDILTVVALLLSSPLSPSAILFRLAALSATEKVSGRSESRKKSKIKIILIESDRGDGGGQGPSTETEN